MKGLRIYLDLKGAFWLLLIIVLLHKPLGDVAVRVVAVLWTAPETQSLTSQLVVGAAGSLIATLLLAGLVALVYPRLRRHRVVGAFDAYDVVNHGATDETEVAWGKGLILFDPLSCDGPIGIPVLVALEVEQNDVKVQLSGRGALLNNAYLVGFYCEKSKPERRRAGGFCYRLSGGGDVWEGPYSFVDPNTENPKTGYVRWKRK